MFWYMLMLSLEVVGLVSVCKPLNSVTIGMSSCFGRSYLVQMNKLYHASKKHKVLLPVHIHVVQKTISIHLFSQSIKITQEVHNYIVCMYIVVTNQTIRKSRNFQDWEEHYNIFIFWLIYPIFRLKKNWYIYIYIINLQNSHFVVNNILLPVLQNYVI